MSKIPFTPKPEYTKLRDLLAAKDWNKADDETAILMLKAIGKNRDSILLKEDFDKFPYDDLRTIDKLWMYYSENRFGYSIQTRLWSTIKLTHQDKEGFKNFFVLANLVGWFDGQEFLNHKSLKFNLDKVSLDEIPKGHFPRWGLGVRGYLFDLILVLGWRGLEVLNGRCSILGLPDSVSIINILVKNHSDSLDIIISFFSLMQSCLLDTVDNDHAININQLDEEVKLLDDENYYTPESREIAQERIIKSIAQRKGQPQFRAGLLEAYNYRCAITGCNAQEALEAAHIIPYCETEDNDISNGLLLRADIHTLFDLNLIAIEPETYKICLAPSLQDSSYYNDIKDKSLELPNPKYSPNKDALEWRWKYFESKSEIG
ncbi:GUN4 domain-containing protein [Anabaena sp. WFMT]|uniref:GUN4 domain-containing protein n=1 Tax=Anabaena sp. WFMT TaxID=3449730 RepID=UPI003F22FF29